MKKLFTLIAATLLAVGVNAQESGKKLVAMNGWSYYGNERVQKEDGTWVYEPVKLDEPTVYDNNYYYYNGKNQKIVEKISAQNYRYVYNGDGTVAMRELWANQGGVFYKSQVTSYGYDEQKNVVSETIQYLNTAGEETSSSVTEYSDFENGEYKMMKTPYYESHYSLEFNDAKQLTAKIQLLQNAEGEWATPNTGDFYTYENGLLVKHTTGYYDASAEAGHEWETNVTTTETYTYDTDGTIKTRYVVTDLRGQHSEVEWRYVYSTLDASLTPQNVTADGTIGNNEVYVKWDVVSGATGYVVMYDNSIAETEKNELITPTLTDGEHQIAVLAIVGGEQKNLSDFVKVSVKDAGNLPMENFKVNGAQLLEGEWSKFYALDCSWDVPEGASPIVDYTVYVDKQDGSTWYPTARYTSGLGQADLKDNYNDVSVWNTGERLYWSTFEDTYYDEDTWQQVSLGKGPTCKLWITATYATGESQKSNVVEVNVYNLANGIQPEEESGKKLVAMNGWSYYGNERVQKEDGTWVYEPVKLDEPTVYDNNYYYYNGKNQKIVEKISAQNYRYVYNGDGTVAMRELWANQGGVFYKSQVTSYGYDEQKNVVSETIQYLNTAGEETSSSVTEYSDFENGEYKMMKTPYYESHYSLEFNDAKQLTAKIQLLQNAEGEWATPNTGDFYTYENGLLVKHTTGYYDASAEAGHEWETNVTTTETYTYDTDGTIKTRYVVTDLRGQHSEVEWRYVYSTLDASLTPQNVTADGTIGNNEVYVKWDVVSGATGYVVMYDNSIAETEKNELITPTLTDGEHQIAVLAIVGGEQKNLSDFVKVSVKDAGNLPMENFKVNGAQLLEGEWSKFYALDCSWDVPEGASPIVDYTVYVDKQDGSTWYPTARYTSGLGQADLKDNYNDVSVWNTGERLYWSTFEDTYYDEDTWQQVSLGKGPTCKLWITATYATGESQKSNVVEVNVYNLANGISDAVEAPKAAGSDVPAEVYNLAGQRVNKAAGRQMLIIKQGDTVKKVMR